MASESTGEENELCVPPNAPPSSYFEEEGKEVTDWTAFSGERSTPVVTVQRMRDLYRTFTIVQVGKDKREFGVHKELICSLSPYFAAHYSGRWSFGPNKCEHMELLSEEPKIFEFFLQWLYSRKLDDESKPRNMPSWVSLVKLHVMADKYGILQLKNDTIDKLVRKRLGFEEEWSDWFWDGKRPLGSGKAVALVEKNSLSGSALRRLMVDFIAWSPLKKLQEEGPSIPPEFLLDVTLVLAGLRVKETNEKKPPYKGNICESYHEHDEVFPILGGCRKRSF
ncbi:MAG: hypothetical protein M1836_001001 [Candelina mexicana]|nr:MAG: hypothetical protein M1836_001001 [Candelina mexicana]